MFVRPRLLAPLALLCATSTAALAFPCPNVMFVLDRSGSMSEDPNGGSTNPTKWKLAQDAVVSVLHTYGAQMPFGLEMFTSSAFGDAQCYADTKIDVQPAHGTAMQITDAVTNGTPGGGTNTGEAIKRAAADPAMRDGNRGQFIILITDGDPNCNSGDMSGSATYTVNQIKLAAKQAASIHTFVVGFDGSGGINKQALNDMANAGLQPQEGCNGKDKPCYYSASNANQFNDAIQKILTVVTGGEFGSMTCDDSCYGTGCPQGQICVSDEQHGPHCENNPCAGVVDCDVGNYCRDGKCVATCPNCKSGTKCVDGTCVNDFCANITCDAGQVCNPADGSCIANPCTGKTCPPSTVCQIPGGTCVDNPCNVIACPAGTTCKLGGNCEADPGTSPTGDTTNAGHARGCAVSHRSGPQAAGALIAAALLAVLRRRRSAR